MPVVGGVLSRLWALVRWIFRLPKWLTLPLGLLAVGLLSYGGYNAYALYDYTQHDPEFCRSCHLMERAWNKWATSEHKDVNCHECHKLSPLAGANLIITYLLERPQTLRKHTFVPDEACAECHESGNVKWTQVAETVGHETHVRDELIACTKCHSVNLHRFAPPSTVCQLCHDQQTIQINAMAQQHCLTCHRFLREEKDLNLEGDLDAEDAGLDAEGVHPDAEGEDAHQEGDQKKHLLLPTREDCLACHQYQEGTRDEWPPDAPMHRQCSECHKPHLQAAPIVECASCHATESVAGLHSQQAHQATECQVCHQPHRWEMPRRSTCVSCHATWEEHYLGEECQLCHKFK